MINVTMRAYNNARSFVNNQESVLTAPNVRKRGIRLAYKHVLPGGDARGTEGQPLVVNGTCYYATQSAYVCAFDAASPKMLWQRNLGGAVKVTRDIDEYLINDHASIYSTGVIDPVKGIYYLAAWQSPDGSVANAIHNFHAIKLDGGAPVHGPLSFEGITYTAVHGAQQLFRSAARKQRAALSLVNGRVYTAFGSVSETSRSARGWLIGYSQASQGLCCALATTSSAKGFGAGFWQGGAGLVADAQNRLYGVTGNGTWDGVLDHGESVLQMTDAMLPGFGVINITGNATFWTDDGRCALDPDGDEYFTPTAVNKRDFSQWEDDGWGDADLGSAPPGYFPSCGVMVVMGKDGVFYPLLASHLPNTRPTDLNNPAANYKKLPAPPGWGTWFPGYDVSPTPDDPRALNQLWNGKTRHQHGEPICWDKPGARRYFCWGENSPLRAWSVSDQGALRYLACSAEIASPDCGNPGGMAGGMIGLSSDQDKDGTGVVWAVVPYGNANNTVTQARLLAYDAESFGRFGDGSARITPIWDSADWGINFTQNKFGRPVVCDGRLFVADFSGDVLVFELA